MPLDQALKLGKRGRPKKGGEKGDIVTLKERGNSSTYILAPLDRDHPALADRVRVGELSANAARRATAQPCAVDEARVGLDGKARRMPVRQTAADEDAPRLAALSPVTLGNR